MYSLQAFARGFLAYFKVIPLFSKLGLWRYLLLTAAVSFLVLLFIGGIAYGVAQLVMAVPYDSILGPYPGFATAIAVIAFLAVIVLGVLLFKHLVLIATSPWMGKVADAVGSHFNGVKGFQVDSAQGKTSNERMSLVKRSIRLNARLLFFEMLLTIPLLLAGLIPGVNIAAAVLLVLVQSYFVGAGTLDFTLEERYTYGESVAYFNNNRGLTIGIGLGFVLLLFTAVGFLFAPAWSAAASSYAFHNQAVDHQTKSSSSQAS